jgi:hypothetical protein
MGVLVYINILYAMDGAQHNVLTTSVPLSRVNGKRLDTFVFLDVPSY